MFVIPRATEKSYLEQTKNTYIFVVPKTASKQAIAKAISQQFNVTVLSVRVLTRKGKATRFSRGKRAYPGTTYRQNQKLAYVTLKAGDKIQVFAEQAEETVENNQPATITKVKAEEQPAKKATIFSRRTGNRGDK